MGKRIYLNKPRVSEKTVAEKYFDKGLSIAGGILLALKEAPGNFANGLPSYYGFDIAKRFSYNPKKKHRSDVSKNTIYVNLHRLQKQG